MKRFSEHLTKFAQKELCWTDDRIQLLLESANQQKSKYEYEDEIGRVFALNMKGHKEYLLSFIQQMVLKVKSFLMKKVRSY